MSLKRIFVISKYLTLSYIDDIFSFKIKEKYKLMAIIICDLLFATLISLFLTRIVNKAYYILELENEQSLLLEYIFASGTIIMFFFMSMILFSFITYNNDIKAILPLPITSGEIIICKFLSCLINLFAISLVILAPLNMYGILIGASPLYYINVIIAVIIFPIYPVAIIGIVMLFINIMKNKIKNEKVSRGIFYLFITLVIFLITKLSNSINNMGVNIVKNKFTIFVNNIFISNKLLMEFIKTDGSMGIVYILLVLILSMIAVFALYEIGKKTYIKGIINYRYSRKSSDFNLENYMNKNIKKRSNLFNLILDEFRLIIRTPAYFFYCILSSLVMPAIFFLSAKESIVLNEDTLAISNSANNMGVIAFTLCISIIFVSANPIGYSSVSMEGKNIIYKLALPIDFKLTIIAKYIVALGINLISLIINLITIYSIFCINTVCIISATILGILAVTLMISINIIIDIRKPKLHWESEKFIFKGNANIYRSLIISVLLIIVIVSVSILTKDNFYIGIIIEGIILGASNIAALRKLLNENENGICNEV